MLGLENALYIDYGNSYLNSFFWKENRKTILNIAFFINWTLRKCGRKPNASV